MNYDERINSLKQLLKSLRNLENNLYLINVANQEECEQAETKINVLDIDETVRTHLLAKLSNNYYGRRY